MEGGISRIIWKCAIQRSTQLKVSEQKILMWLFLKTDIKNTSFERKKIQKKNPEEMLNYSL